jgi:hypothetical protein
MGLFFEVIIVGAVVWWLCLRYLRSRRERQVEQEPPPGSHDSGVWFNDWAWTRIVADLEKDSDRGDSGPRPGRHE